MERQPRKKTDVDILVANIKSSIEQIEEILPDDPEDDLDDDEPDSADLVAYKRHINKLRKDFRSLRRPPR